MRQKFDVFCLIQNYARQNVCKYPWCPRCDLAHSANALFDMLHAVKGKISPCIFHRDTIDLDPSNLMTEKSAGNAQNPKPAPRSKT